MLSVSSATLPWIEQRSPSGKFRSFFRNVTPALNSASYRGPRFGGFPFDVQIRRVAAGASIAPYHLHVAQSEFFFVQSGTGVVRVESGTFPVKAGDFFFHPPGEAHQLFAAGADELVVLIVADNPDVDVVYYPDSNKWAMRPPWKIFRMTEVDYFEGEDEEPSHDGPHYQPPKIGLDAPASAFTSRFRNLAAVPWEIWESPKKKFRGASKELSIALGAKRNTPAGLGGHTFDVEYGKLDARECGCPFHSHTAQTEFFMILEGSATIRTKEGLMPLQAGDAVLHPPQEAHQLLNTSDAPMYYLCIADNPQSDSWHYPDSNKYGFRQPRKIFRTAEADYWEGEE